MCSDVKDKQIRVLLSFDWAAELGPLIVGREDVRTYVRQNGLPKKSPKSGEISYEKKDDSWVVTYWEKNVDIGNKSFPDEMTVLEEILDHSLPAYIRFNRRDFVI